MSRVIIPHQEETPNAFPPMPCAYVYLQMMRLFQKAAEQTLQETRCLDERFDTAQNVERRNAGRLTDDAKHSSTFPNGSVYCWARARLQVFGLCLVRSARIDSIDSIPRLCSAC